MPRDVQRISIALLLLFTSLAAGAAHAKPDKYYPSCGGIFDLCGYIDRETRVEIIPRRFERAFNFSEDLAAVRINGLYGFIDRAGKIVIEPKFDLAGSFFLGLAEVLLGNQTGVINRKGEIVVEPRFARSIAFTENVLLVREGKWKRQHFRGYEKLQNLGDPSGLYGKGWRLLHIHAGWVSEQTYQLRMFNKIGGGLIWASTKRGVWGLLRPDGTWQIEPQYSHVQFLNDGRAIVRKPVGITNKGQRPKELHGAVDETGKLVIPLKDEALSYWTNGVGLIHKDGQQGLLDKTGKLIGGCLFEKVDRGGVGGILRGMIDGQWVGIDRTTGKILADGQAGKIVASCPSGIKIRVRSPRRFQVIGANGNPTTPLLFDYVNYSRFLCDRPNAVRIGSRAQPDRRWSYIGLDGRLLFNPPPFDAITKFSKGHALVRKNGKWGILDDTGKFRIEPEFDELRVFGSRRCVSGHGITCLSKLDDDTVFQAKLDGEELTIDLDGKRVAKPTNPTPRTRYLSCPGGAQLIADKSPKRSNSLWGLTDKKGRVIIKPEYRALHCFKNGVAWAASDQRQKWCPIGPDGRMRNKPACVVSRYPYIQTHSRPEKFSNDPYENSVLWTRAFLDYGAGLRDTPPKMIGRGGNAGTFSRMR